MRQTWRWFGPADRIGISELRQVGVEGVVSALHHVPPGTVWTAADMAKRHGQIANLKDGSPSGMKWEVVESLPVSEAIKTQGPEYRQHISAYQDSLRNIAASGIEVVCYNFMPILDWTRTELKSEMAHGGTAMKFDLIDFAIFDMFILERPNARADYGEEILEAASARFGIMDEQQKAMLRLNTIAGLPGSHESWTVAQIRDNLGSYAAISPDRLRGNLIDFLAEVVPVAEEVGIRLCCHPDDPPFSLLGLPRIMSCERDYETVMEAVDSPNSGITLCTGSLGIAEGFDAPGFVERLGHRIHFAHLRNTIRLAPSDGSKTSFFEAAHLEGDTDMVAVVRALTNEEKKRKNAGRPDWEIPMRPDHGQDILDDLKRDSMPGYPLIGRMRGMAELRGIMAAFAS